jgi:hypothetical protein
MVDLMAAKEAATDHRPVDESSAVTPNTKVGHHRETMGGRGVDDPPATTKHDRAVVDAGSAAVRVNPTTS